MNKKRLMAMTGGTIAIAIQVQSAFAQFEGLSGTEAKIEIISVDDLNSLLTKQQQAEQQAKEQGIEPPVADFVVVDVRSEAEVNVSVIPGSITKAQYEKDPKQYQDRTVIPYCTVGGRSGKYAKQLQQDGVKVKNFSGSIIEWCGAELPLVTLDGKPTNRVHTYSDRNRVPAQYEAVTK